METTELVWQQQFARELHLTASLYRNHVNDSILESILLNTSGNSTFGQELGIEYVEPDGLRLNTSIAHLTVANTQGNPLVNSPHWLGKLNVVLPLIRNHVNAGFEVKNTGRCYDYTCATVKANAVANLTFNSSRLIEDANISLNIRNLFNSQQEDVQDIGLLRTMPLPGRQYRLQLEYTLKRTSYLPVPWPFWLSTPS